MKICFFANNFSNIGGLEKVLFLVASELTKTNDVHIVSMYNIRSNSANIYSYPSEIKLNVIFDGKKEYIKHIVPSVKYLRNYLINNEIDVVIATSEFVGPYCYYATKGTKAKYMCWTHSPALVFDESIIHRPIKDFSFRHADAIISLTEYSKKILEKKYKGIKNYAIPNPLDPSLSKANKYNFESHKIITVGRYCPQKNFENLIDVAKVVLDKNIDWSWDLYGDGDMKIKTYLQQKIKEYRLGERFILKGNVTNLYDLYSDYAMLVMTSRRECFPMVLLEGIANKLPLIAYDVETGPCLLINDSKNGYLIKAFDTNEMINKIQCLIDNEDIRKQFSDNNAEFINEYDIVKIGSYWNKAIEEVINEK